MQVLAYVYPLLGIFWTMLWFFLFVLWIWLVIWIFIDIFRSPDMNGWIKALWVLFIIVVPWLGVLIYVIARGGSMHERSAREAKVQQDEFDEYVRETATAGSPADQLATLANLHDQGKLSDEDYEKAKAKVLA